jgi:hypothetical protein
VAGGHANTNLGYGGFIGGGATNYIEVTASNAVIGGGSLNRAFGHVTTVAGGATNTASGLAATVSGGVLNTASAFRATVAGGAFNTNSGVYGFIGGGATNYIDATASNAVIGGGARNTASGQYATVPGGVNCHATHAGSFVLSGDEFESTDSWGDRTFTVRARGGVRFYTASGIWGAVLAAGSGSWTSLSDRKAKENFQPVDAAAILAKVAAMPVMTWNYKTQHESVRHIGPMAQDFKEAFGIGESATGITTVDADGVAFAAIQGLAQELEAKSARLEQLEAELRALREQVQNGLPPAP